MSGNVIYKSIMLGRNKIRLDTIFPEINGLYKLMEFAFSHEEQDFFGAGSNDLNLSQKQIDLIQSTPRRDILNIINTRFIDAKGRIHHASDKEIFIED